MTKTEDYLSFAEASRRIGRPAKTISTAVFSGRLDASSWPKVAGKTLVPVVELPRIREVLATDRRRKVVATK